ncbi:13913_t:CDS:2, partial [Funneliformis caledonium]
NDKLEADLEYSNDESDFNEDENVIEDIEEQIEVGIKIDSNVSRSISEDLTNVLKYSDEKSPMDIWKLPSEITVTKAICDSTILHKSHLSNLGIICVRANVR